MRIPRWVAVLYAVANFVLLVLSLIDIPDQLKHWFDWLKVVEPYISHEAARWLLFLIGWGSLYPMAVWRIVRVGTADHSEADFLQLRSSFPREVVLRQSPMDRMLDQAKEKRAERDRAEKQEGARQLTVLRDAGMELRGRLNKNLTHKIDLLDEIAAWLTQLRDCLTRHVSEAKAVYVVSAPFEKAPHGFEPGMRDPAVRRFMLPVYQLYCVTAVLKRLDEVLGEY